MNVYYTHLITVIHFIVFKDVKSDQPDRETCAVKCHL
jgi:hypothetical protein